VAFSPKTARTRNTNKKDDLFGRQRKKREGHQRHQCEVANKYTSSNVVWKSTVTMMTWQTTVNCCYVWPLVPVIYLTHNFTA